MQQLKENEYPLPATDSNDTNNDWITFPTNGDIKHNEQPAMLAIDCEMVKFRMNLYDIIVFNQTGIGIDSH
jgi:hypothetical protein